MAFVTDFADQGVILPLAAIIAVLLSVLGWWRGAAAWVLTVGGVLGTLGLLKAAFHVCAGPSGPWAGWGIQSPSGHAAAAAVTYGGIVLLLGRDRLPLPVLVAAPCVVAVVIGISRMALHAHNLLEVSLGSAIGLCGAAALLPLAGPQPPLRRWPVLAVVLLVAAAFHGVRLQAEHTIHVMADTSWLKLGSLCRMS